MYRPYCPRPATMKELVHQPALPDGRNLFHANVRGTFETSNNPLAGILNGLEWATGVRDKHRSICAPNRLDREIVIDAAVGEKDFALVRQIRPLRGSNPYFAPRIVSREFHFLGNV